MQVRAGVIRAHEMVKAWQSPADVGILVAGETSFDRLSAIVDIIKKGIMHPTDDSPFNNTLPSCKDVLSPSGSSLSLLQCVRECVGQALIQCLACAITGRARVLRLVTCIQRTRSWINLCAIRRPRYAVGSLAVACSLLLVRASRLQHHKQGLVARVRRGPPLSRTSGRQHHVGRVANAADLRGVRHRLRANG
jgi:hypothetical protein